MENYIKQTKSSILLKQLRQKYRSLSEEPQVDCPQNKHFILVQLRKLQKKYTFPMGRKKVRQSKPTTTQNQETTQQRRVRASKAAKEVGNFYSEMNRLELMGYFEQKPDMHGVTENQENELAMPTVLAENKSGQI
jgi:hypothetical protein